MARGGLGNRGGGRGRAGARGRGGARGAQAFGGRPTQVLRRFADARAALIPQGFALIPVTQATFPVTQAANLADGMTNAAVEHVVQVGPDQGPRSALLMLKNVIPENRKAARPTRTMDWQCICTDLSCANNLSISALSTVSDQQYYTWLVNHKIVWQVTYCTKPARTGKNNRIIGHSRAEAIRMRLNLKNNRHVCPHPTCRATVCHLGPLSNGYAWQNPQKLMIAVLNFSRGMTITETRADTDFSINGHVQLRQRFDRLLAGLQFNRNREARGTLLICQADEFCFWKTMYERGKPTTALGQLWFQSIAELDTEGRCTRFFIRPVNNRNTQTLCTWISDMVCNFATVTTDCWAGYHALQAFCAAKGKQITHNRVNHSSVFKNAHGQTTNVVECMHHHVRSIMNNTGNDGEKRICRIMAACAVAQPGSDRRIVRFLQCIREIVLRGFTFEDTLCQDVYHIHVRYAERPTT